MSKADIILRGMQHKAYEFIGMPSPLPFSATLSLTNRCDSRCKLCNIWKLHDSTKEFETWEWEKLITQIGPYIKFYTISGGEPFIREDLADILSLLFKYGNPTYLTLSTNCLAPERVRDQLEKFLLRLDRKTSCTAYCNLSVDGVGRAHDELRGVEGNFSKVCETIKYLGKIRDKTRNLKLKIGIHTVISKLNVDEVERICNYFLPIKDIDSIICEIAEQRNELHNTENTDAPSSEEFLKVTNLLVEKLSHEKRLDRTILSLRSSYYQFVDKWLQTGRQPLPCFAGRASCHVTSDGNVVSCPVRWKNTGFMGSLREERYDFRKIWYSDQAERIRRAIRKKECSCPLCNAYYSSLACNAISSVKTWL